MKLRTTGAVALMVALASVLVVLQLSAGATPNAARGPTAATAATVTGDTAVGQTGSCQVDASGYCTLNHNLGVKPKAAVVTAANIGQLASVDYNSFTATTWTVRFYWHTGALFPAGTTIRFNVLFTIPATAPSPSPTPTATTTSPSPTPTVSSPPPSPSPTPSPTPTAGTSPPVKTCTSSTPGYFTTTSTNNTGDGVTYGGKYFVHNNMWNNSNGTYTLTACNFDNWYELATQPLPADRGVQTYPNVHQDYSDVALFNTDGTAKIRSARFAAQTPATCSCIYDVAFDIWLGSNFSNELMIWTDNLGQTPAGTKVGTATFSGQTYDVWHETGYTAYVSQVTQKYGTMPLGSIFTDMKNRGWLPTATTWQVDFGVEIVSTAGVQKRFDFTDFGIDEDY